MFKWLLILFLCLCGTNSFAAKKIEAAKEDLSDIQEKIQALKKELNSNQEAHKDATDALKDSETAISAANQKLREINQKQNKNKNALNSLKKQSVNLNESLNQQQQQLSNLLKQQYMQGNQSYTQLILQNKNPSEIARDVKYFSYIAKAQAKVIDDMQSNLVKVKELNNKTAVALQEVADLKAKQEVEKKELEQQKQEKAKVVKTLSKQITAQRNEIDKLKRDEKSLSNLVERLAKIIPKKAKKSPKKRQPKNDEENNEKTNQTIAKNEETPTNAYSGSDFAALKGKLHLPVRGDVTNHFGSPREDTGITWKGLFIKAAEGNDVKSVADGRVVFADWMRGFGNLIIVDHGDGYMSLYGNNQAVLKHVGDEVNAGDAIASVGNSGGNESNGLYYELRHQSQPFDPLKWSVVR
jgi:septal ring factor EnvC (AmiA/AmiB activator)